MQQLQLMNFKFVPRLRVRGTIRRWTLHPEDYITIDLRNVDASLVDPTRGDLHYLNCGRMPRVVLDALESHMDSFWTCVEWANDDCTAHFANGFRTGLRVPAYNVNGLELPSSGLCRLKATVQGIHCDTKLGNTYSPILIIEEVIADRAAPPSITAGRKRMISISSSEDEDEEEDEEEEPAVKRQRMFDDESSEDENIEAVHAQNPEEEEEAAWIANFLQGVESPVPAEPVPQLPPPPQHPCLINKSSRTLWLQGTELYRQRYFRCPRHGGFICPDCKLHVPDWNTFVANHYGCCTFSEFSKALVCDMCHNN